MTPRTMIVIGAGSLLALSAIASFSSGSDNAIPDAARQPSTLSQPETPMAPVETFETEAPGAPAGATRAVSGSDDPGSDDLDMEALRETMTMAADAVREEAMRTGKDVAREAAREMVPAVAEAMKDGKVTLDDASNIAGAAHAVGSSLSKIFNKRVGEMIKGGASE